METTSEIPLNAQTGSHRVAATAIPWSCLAAVFGAACIPIGVLWDISWHSTIGRDTFWTPAHMVIYLGGVVPGFSCGWLAFKTTFFGTADERAASVKLFGARAPLGAWVAIWGAIAMCTSAPFDDWWHNAYGLDVQILSPPHSLLAIGMFGVALGCLLLVLSWQNRSAGRQQERIALIFVLIAGVMVTMHTVFVTERSFPNQQHGLAFYLISCAFYPSLLITAARASTLRWPATIAAATYMGIMCAMIWALPLFAATPRLAPIYRPVTHMVPPSFPLLLIVPALAIDLLLRWWNAREHRAPGHARASALVTDKDVVLPLFTTGWQRQWLLALMLGATFLALLLAVQWPFSTFLLSDGADNWFFAREGHWPYYSPAGDWSNRFWTRDGPTMSVPGLAMALGIAVISARVGLWQGNWMLNVRR